MTAALEIEMLQSELARAQVSALEQETRALNAERALEQLQDEVVSLRHLVAGSVPVAELRVALELTAREQRSDTLPDLARVIALVEAAEQRAAALTPATEGGPQAVLVDDEFVRRDTDDEGGAA